MQEEHCTFYTADDLIALASEEQIPLSKRAIRAWPVWGGLAPATPIGRGPSEGVGRVWTTEQAMVFMHVVRSRSAGLARGKVVNLPVGFWLVLGDVWVPIEQVRRAMATWIAHYKRLSKREVKAQARQHLGLTDEVRELLERDPSARHKLAHRASAVPAVDDVEGYARFMADAGGLLPNKPRPLNADAYALAAQARNRGVAIFPEVSDELLHRARDHYRPTFETRKTKLQQQGLPFAEVSKRLRDEEIGCACPNLLTHLGALVEEDAAFATGFAQGLEALLSDQPLIHRLLETRAALNASRQSIADSNRRRHKRIHGRTRR